MAKLDNVRRIIAEDFDKEDQAVAGKLGNVLNQFMEQVVNTVNGNIEIENLDRELIELEVTVGSSGTPNQTVKFSANQGIRGSKVIRALNLTNSLNYVDSAPFITFTPSGTGIYTINHITGLKVNQKYRLLIELIP